jgi:hypothetical protein
VGASKLLPLTVLIVCRFVGQATAASQPSIVVRWNNAALQGIRDSRFGAPTVARALAIVHTCMYDAWAAYDATALGTQLRGALLAGRIRKEP